jgi:sensor histidine kinase YesM
MIVNLNGQFWYDTEVKAVDEMVVIRKSNKLKNFAIALWTSSGLFLTKTAVHAETFYESMQPLTYVFQDIALGLGILFALSGLILLGFKKRWGTITLKTTAFVVGGVFLVPSALMLFGIIGTLLNEALTEAFEGVRGAKDVKDVMNK